MEGKFQLPSKLLKRHIREKQEKFLAFWSEQLQNIKMSLQWRRLSL